MQCCVVDAAILRGGPVSNHLHLAVVVLIFPGHAVAQLVEVLRYKPEGRGLDSRWCH
jgi:hypothetical protein